MLRQVKPGCRWFVQEGGLGMGSDTVEGGPYSTYPTDSCVFYGGREGEVTLMESM